MSREVVPFSVNAQRPRVLMCDVPKPSASGLCGNQNSGRVSSVMENGCGVGEEAPLVSFAPGRCEAQGAKPDPFPEHVLFAGRIVPTISRRIARRNPVLERRLNSRDNNGGVGCTYTKTAMLR